jgi:hypothetical protein
VQVSEGDRIEGPGVDCFASGEFGHGVLVCVESRSKVEGLRSCWKLNM